MSTHASLTPREAEVLRLCGRGLSNLEIAEQLTISVGTIKGHLHQIFRKFEVRNRTAAVAKSRELGFH
jgi:LuxR family maltose regulon positive regulatory protein